MKRSRMIAILMVLVIGAAIVFFLPKALSVMTGYTAKYVCSSYFLSGSNEVRLTKDLDFFPINKVKYTIDETSRSVTAKVIGLGAKTAFYYENGISGGCSFHPPQVEVSKTNYRPPVISDTLEWPLGNGDLNPHLENVNYARLDSFLQETMDSNLATLAICVAYKGNLIGEAYGVGITPEKPLLGWSMTKTVANAVVGRMVMQDKIDVNKKNLWPSWQDERAEISLWNLLQMNSGLDFSENYFMLSDVTRMLYLKEDKAAYASKSKLKYEPGTHWYYSSGTTNLISGVIRQHFQSQSEYLLYPHQELFDKLGMGTAFIETDVSGNYVMSSYGWASARDWTRFGQFLLDDGVWDSQRLLPEGWVAKSVSPAAGSDGLYGAQIWLNTEKKAIKNVPADAFFENGFGGQRVLVIPSRSMVVSVLSGMQMNFDFERLYQGIFDCVAD